VTSIEIDQDCQNGVRIKSIFFAKSNDLSDFIITLRVFSLTWLFISINVSSKW